MKTDDAPQTRAEAAAILEDAAARIVQLLNDGDGFPSNAEDAVPIAHVMATLSVGQRIADLTDKLGEYFGDDSNLDRIKQALYDADGTGLAEDLDWLRKTIEERPV